MNIKFPDGSIKQFENGTTPLQIAESISSRLAQDVLAATLDGEEWDLTRPIVSDGEIKLFKWDDPEGKHAFWHTSAHLLAEALQELYPGVKFGIGPAIENGFYYDIDPGEHTITSADFPKIEAKMAELVAKKEAVVRKDISKEDALKMFGDRNETYKCELISELEDGHITTYTQGAFKGLHLYEGHNRFACFFAQGFSDLLNLRRVDLSLRVSFTLSPEDSFNIASRFLNSSYGGGKMIVFLRGQPAFNRRTAYRRRNNPLRHSVGQSKHLFCEIIARTHLAFEAVGRIIKGRNTSVLEAFKAALPHLFVGRIIR